MQQGKHAVQSRLLAWFQRLGEIAHSRERSSGRPAGTLDAQAVLLLAVQGFFGAAGAVSGTFVPVFLWKTSQSYALLGWYTLTQYVTSGLTFWLAGKWIKEHNKMNGLRLGVALSGGFYLAVLMLGEQAKAYMIALGVLNGVAAGLFWLAYNVVYFEITEPDNRDKFNGWAGFLGSAAGILAPWISGIVITSRQGLGGYRIIFTISLIIYGAAVILSFWLRKRKFGERYDWLHTIRQLKERGNPWRRVAPAIALQGVREGVFMFLVGLMVYVVTRSEKMVGNFSLITSLVALGAFWVTGKLLSVQNRKLIMLIGVIMISAVITVLFFGFNYTALLVFGIGTSLFMPLYTIPMTSTVFDLIGRTEESARQRVEFIVMRELMLTAGRSVGLLAYMAVVPRDDSPLAIAMLLLAVGAMPIAGWWFIRPILAAPQQTRT
ncbi:MFS transporter [Paenibacillus cisolokensis]|uniref:MFS transporter n=1 Tax=Paenibacillus cisolokensis TaxID=1658519 RepID=UPI003D2D72DD